MAILSVTQLNRYVGFRIKEDHTVQGILVRGEICSFTRNFRSGHCYFTLRDAESGVKAVMFRTQAQRLRFLPEDGMAVIAAASASLYEKEGTFQLYVTDLQPDGAGMQAMAFEALKKKLSALGVFDASAKHSLPFMPKKIGVITSDSGAALQDIKNVIGRRYPIGTILVYPAQVQGVAAPESVAHAILAAEKGGCDVLIVGRGGGGAEDLQAFNTEQVVMAIYHCNIPIVSAVGHETDWTLADAAADLRAPTPSAAAELAVPDMHQIMQQIAALQKRMEMTIHQHIVQHEQTLRRFSDRLRMQSPMHQQILAHNQLQTLIQRLHRCGRKLIESREILLRQQAARLEMLSPLTILGRGYALVYRGDDLIRYAAQLSVDDTLIIRFSQGTATVKVQAITDETEA